MAPRLAARSHAYLLCLGDGDKPQARSVPAAVFTITHLLTWNIGLLCTTPSKAFLKSEEITARLLLLTLGAVSLKNSIRLTKHGFTMVPCLPPAIK